MKCDIHLHIPFNVFLNFEVVSILAERVDESFCYLKVNVNKVLNNFT